MRKCKETLTVFVGEVQVKGLALSHRILRSTPTYVCELRAQLLRTHEAHIEYMTAIVSPSALSPHPKHKSKGEYMSAIVSTPQAQKQRCVAIVGLLLRSKWQVTACPIPTPQPEHHLCPGLHRHRHRHRPRTSTHTSALYPNLNLSTTFALVYYLCAAK